MSIVRCPSPRPSMEVTTPKASATAEREGGGGVVPPRNPTLRGAEPHNGEGGDAEEPRGGGRGYLQHLFPDRAVAAVGNATELTTPPLNGEGGGAEEPRQQHPPKTRQIRPVDGHMHA
jgi:hypothetical protein